MITRFLIFSALYAVLFLTGIPAGAQQAPSQVVINEILASNSSGIVDEDGDAQPWIELFNRGNEPVRLAGFGLSDDDGRPWRWVFPDTTIAPGEFLLVFASGKNRAAAGRPMHAGFRVSRFGEPVSLTDFNGNVLDRVPPIELPVDVSYGRLPDGADNWAFFNRPTPGFSNESDGFDEILDPPVFSHEGGFYTSGFDLYLDIGASESGVFSSADGERGSAMSAVSSAGSGPAASTPGIQIRYTIDGSEPDSTSPVANGPIRITDRTPEPNGISTIPTSPPEIPLILGYKWHPPQGQVFKGTVVRARAFRDGSKPSPVATHTYFVDSRGDSRYNLPVVSLSTDSLHLFDHETGIYVPGIHYELGGPEDDPKRDEPHLFGNYVQRGIEWERPASMEFFDEQGQRVFAQDIGIRVHGGRSRTLPLKSLRLYARSDYGESRFNYPFFPDLPYRDYNRLILRNSGQDFFGRSTMFRDGFMQTLVRELNMDTQEYRATVVFINGEFWGIMNIRERYDEDYLARTWGVDPDNVDLLQNEMDPKAGDSLHYSAMMDFIQENDPASREVYDQIRTMMDVDNYLDYIIAQMIIRNVDWPGNNIEYWRLRTDWNPDAPPGHDGRWRWMVVDMDAGFGLLNPWRVASFDMIRHMTNDKHDGFSNDPWSTVLIRRLLRNDEFRTEFIRRSADYLNTIFLPEHVIALIDRFEESLEPVIEEHILRWGQIESKSRWHFNVERMRDFAQRRPGYVREHLMDFFGLKEMFRIQVDVSATHKGRVQVNHLTIDENTAGTAGRESPWPWTGTYFKGIPLDLKARPYSGYRFSHWEEYDQKTREVTRIHSWQEQIRIHNGMNMGLRAVFVPASEAPDLYPEPHVLEDGPYHFRAWEPDAEPGSFPENMAFQYMADTDPGLRSPVAGFTNGAYNLDSRTRINGLGDAGFAFLNTSSPEGNPGYPGTRLGAAVLALDTRGMKNIRVSWTGGTVEPNSRVYHLRLQYRINGEGEYRDVTDEWGDPVEYRRHHEAGHSLRFVDIRLPQSVWNKPYVELRWKYYFTGEQADPVSGSRAQLRVADITVTADPMLVHEGEEITEPQIRQNYPNPFNNTTNIRIFLPQETQVSVSLFDVSGRLVRRVRDHMRLSAGYHTIRVDAGDLAGGIYVYRVDTPGWTAHGKMTLIR